MVFSPFCVAAHPDSVSATELTIRANLTYFCMSPPLEPILKDVESEESVVILRIPTKPGHPFRFKGGHVFRSEAGHHSDLMAAGVASSRRVTLVVSRSADLGQVGA